MKRIAIAIAAPVVFLMLLEAGAIAYEFAKHGTIWVKGQPLGLYDHRHGEPPHLKPGASLTGLAFKISINSHGMRGPEILVPKPDNGLRVWCVGGSTTFDIYAPDDASTWPARTQEVLRQALPDRVVEVLNAGIPGEIIQGSERALLELGPGLRPDLVVLYHGPNDLRALLDNTDQMPPPKFHLPPMPDFTFFRMMRETFQQGGHGRSFAPRAWEPGIMMEMRRRLESLIRATQKVGAEPVFATHPARFSADSSGEVLQRQAGGLPEFLHLPPEQVRQVFRRYNDTVKSLARSAGLPVADVRGKVPESQEYWGDSTHFAPAGSKIAGEEVARAILEQLRQR